MKVKLTGALLMAAACFVFSQSDWELPYLIGGALLAFPAALLLTPRRRYPRRGEVRAASEFETRIALIAAHDETP